MSIRTRRKPMRAVAAAAAAAVGASLLAISGPAQVGAAPTVTEDTRIAGADRYATANDVAIAVDRGDVGGAGDERVVVIASGENFPDGLSAAALAGALNAPMLLTQSASLPTSVLETLTTITATATAPKSVVLIGGTSVISADIATQLTASGYSVSRFAGADRYATANAVAEAVYANNGNAIGLFGGYRTAFLANGTNFPDALAASSWAYRNKHPLFLTDGSTLTDETVDAMEAVGVQQIIILGGTSAVSDEVATAAAAVTGVVTTTRVDGDTRYDTATKLATTLATVDADYKTRAILVSGTNFPDALSAAQLAGQATSYAIIPVTDPLPAAVSTWIAANQSTLTNIRAIGGTAAVPAEIVTQVKTEGTTAPLTAIIAGLDGGSAFTVTFSGAVTAASAQAAASYRVTSALGTAKAINAGTYNSTTKTVTVTLQSGTLAPGDVIQVMGTSVVSSATAGLYVAATSFTVAADTTAPTVTITAYPTTVSAARDDVARVWLTFSSNASVSSNPTGVAAALKANLFYYPQTIGSAAQSFAQVCAQYGATSTYYCEVNDAYDLVAGGTVSLAKDAVVSTASVAPGALAIGNVRTDGTVTADAVKPAITSATFTQSGTAEGALLASRVIGGTAPAANLVTISARAEAAKSGVAGNSVRVAVVSNSATHTVPTCSYTAATNTVTISALATSSAQAVALACSNNTAFNALFTVTAGTGQMLALSAADTNLADPPKLAGGQDLVTINLTLSEPMDVFTGLSDALAIAGVETRVDGGTSATILGIAAKSGGAVAVAALPTADAQRLAGSVTVLAVTNGTIRSGVTTINLKADATKVADRAGNTGVATALVAMTSA